MKAELA